MSNPHGYNYCPRCGTKTLIKVVFPIAEARARTCERCSHREERRKRAGHGKNPGQTNGWHSRLTTRGGRFCVQCGERCGVSSITRSKGPCPTLAEGADPGPDRCYKCLPLPRSERFDPATGARVGDMAEAPTTLLRAVVHGEDQFSEGTSQARWRS